METSHNRQLGTSRASNRVTVPFYVPPPSVKKTSTEIINEARAAIQKSGGGPVSVALATRELGTLNAIRPLDTKRPFTPRERQRTLFGTSNSYSRRPPSSFSLGYLQHQDPDLGSTTPPHVRRLLPLPHSPSSLNSSLNSSHGSTSSGERESSPDTPLAAPGAPGQLLLLQRLQASPPKGRLPAIGSAGLLGLRRNLFRATASLDNLPEEVEGEDAESSIPGNNANLLKEMPLFRKAYSSPIQRSFPSDKDLFGSLESDDQPSPVSNKRSFVLEVDLNRRVNEKQRSGGAVKKYKGDAWATKTDKFDKSQVSENHTGIKQKASKAKDPLVSDNEVDDIFSVIPKSQEFDERKTEDEEESVIRGVTQVTTTNLKDIRKKQSNTAKKHSQNKIDAQALKDENHNSEGLLNAYKNASNIDKLRRNSDIRPGSAGSISETLFKTTLPSSPDKAYLASAKEALFRDSEKPFSGGKISDSCSNNTVQGIGQSATNDDPFIPKWKHDNFKAPEPFITERPKKPADVDPSPTPLSSKAAPAIPEPIMGPIQQAMLDNFPPMQAKLSEKENENEVQIIRTNRPKSAKKVKEPVKIDPIKSALDTLTELSQGENNDIEVILALSKLYKALEAENHFGSNAANSGKIKSQVLKTVYKFVERSNETLLLQIARIILAFRVTGSNLSGVCKLVFKVSRCDKNDRLFLEDNLLELFVEALGSASPLDDAEACVYGYGALKFLTMNSVVLSSVLDFGILELMVLHMKLVNAARSEGSRIQEQTSHALFQLTGALRNVAGEEEMFPQFVSTGAVFELCRAMELFSSDLDVISNVSRTLSIISTHDDCCNAIIEYKNCFRLFVKLLQKYPGRQDIVVRLGYALGNLMGKSEVARFKFYEEEGAVSSMLNLLSIYIEKEQQMQDLEPNGQFISSDAGSSGSVEDVIVKIIRILANMSINPLVGSKLSGASPGIFKFPFESNEMSDETVTLRQDEADTTHQYSNRFLNILLAILHRKNSCSSEELTHSALSSLHNLSFYTCGESTLGERQLEIAEVLTPILDSENKECIIETMRIFGNLTRTQESRNYLLESGGFAKLLQFLDSEDRDVLCTLAGILVNMMADWDKRITFKEENGIQRLILILKNFCEGDWQLASLVCQALWNYCIESENLHAALGCEETNDILGLLADYLDEERLFGVKEGTEVNETVASSPAYQLWEEFATVATNLLEKIDMFLDSLEPLEVLPSPIQGMLEEPQAAIAPVVNGHEE